MSKILVVDDSVSMRKLVAKTLTDAGHEVREAGDGKAALVMLECAKYQLVISDWNMPVMNGLTLIQEFRKQGGLCPVLVLTTEVDAAKKAEAKQAGATGWLVKPFDPSVLLATVKRVL